VLHPRAHLFFGFDDPIDHVMPDAFIPSGSSQSGHVFERKWFQSHNLASEEFGMEIQ